MDDILDKIRGILGKDPGHIVFAYLFGSRAKKENVYPPRDVDLAVFFEVRMVKSFPEARIDLYGILNRTLRVNEIDLVILNTATNLKLVDEIMRHGTLVLDRDPVLRLDFEQKILHRAIDSKSQRAALIGF